MTGTFRSFRTTRKAPASRRLDLELLEPRDVPATITVTNALDDTTTGNGVSLREALLSINQGSNYNSDVTASGAFGTGDTILFNSGLGGSTVSIGSELPFTKPVTVTGPTAGLTVSKSASATNVRIANLNLTATGGSVTLANLTLTGGSTSAVGGGIANFNAALTLNNTTVSGNTSTSTTGGGGIYLGTGASVALTNGSSVRNNTTSGYGGGILAWPSSGNTVTLSNSTVANNTASFNGGGLAFYWGGTLTVDNSTISGNTSSANYGGLYLWSPTTVIRTSTISGNSAGTGGGIGIASSATVTLRNSTVAGNNATSSGGGISGSASAIIAMASNIIARNTIGGALGGLTSDLSTTGTIAGASNNLVGVLNPSLTLGGTGNLTGTTASPLDPKLGALAANGGLTQTRALLAGSPAINAGLAPLSPLPNVDQRGQAAIGTRDIGAFEFAPVPAPPTFTSANTATFIAGTFSSFTVTTAGFPIPSITRSGVLPTGVTFVNNGDGTATLAGTPALGTGGSYSLVFTAANGLSPNGTQNFTLRVNQKPAFTSANTTTFIAGTPGSFTVTTSGFPAPAISALNNLPSGISLIDNGDGTANLTGTAFVSDTYTINLTAANGVLPDAFQTFTLKVVQPPAFVSNDAVTFTEGTPGSFTVTAIGAPLPRVSLSGGSLPAGVTFTYIGNGIGTLAGTPAAGTAGSYDLTFSAINGVNPSATQNFTLTVVPPPPPPVSPPPTSPPPTSPPPTSPPPTSPPPTPQPSRPTPVVLVGSPNSGPNGSEVRVLDIGTFNVVKTFTPFPGFGGNLSTAIADLNGDGVVDYVVGAGAGGGPHVKVFDGRSGAELQSFYAFAPFFGGGVSVATGDVNGDGKKDVIVAAGIGGGPHVKVFDGNDFALIRSFYAYDPNFFGGVNVGAADLNGDGREEIITGAKSSGGPHVKAFDGMTLTEVLSFYAFDPTFAGGVSVAGADLNGNGRDQIVVGAGPGYPGGPTVRVFNASGVQTGEFLAYAPTFAGGVNVAAADLNADGKDEIVTGAGPSGGPHVKAFDGLSFDEKFSIYAGDESFRGGVLVG